MRRKIGRLISLVVLIFSLNIVVCQASTESHISPIDENKYMVVEDSFDRGLWSGISTRIKASINQIFKNNNGTIYEDLQIKYITVDGKRLNTEEVKKNPNLLKDVFLNRDNSKGLQNIDITSINQDKYSYSRYLNLIQQDIQPLQIALNTIWTKEKGPYFITGEVQVLKGATLTIEEGTTVYFNNIAPNKNKSGILVDGKLKIEGTEKEPVRLLPRSESRSEGSWKGIYVTERGTLDVEYAKIEGAGSWTGSAIYALGNAKLNHIEINNTLGNGITAFKNIEIQNSIIKNNSGYGIDLYRYLKDYKTIVTDNVFTNNQSFGRIIIRDTKSTEYNVTNNKIDNNEMDNILLGGSIVGKMEFTNPGEDSGYQIINTHSINGEMDKFFISKNSEISFNNTQININTNTKSISDSEIDINGKLIINNSLITNGDYDNWYGLYISDTGEFVMNNSHLANAIKPIFSKGKVTLNQSKIKNTLSGIYSEGDLVSLDSEFKNIRSSAFKSYTFNKKTNLIINNTKFSDIQGSIGDVYVSQSGGNIKFSNVKTDDKVKENFIHLSGSLSESTDFDNIGDGIPYVISDLSILKDATVNFNAGSILKIENGVYFGYKSGIDVYGELNLNGTSNNRVSVTSFRDDRIGGDSNGDGKNSIASAGDWGSINYHASSKNRNSQITYTDILYGGDHREGYAIGGAGKFNIQHSKVGDSSEAGIGVIGTITIENSNLERNQGYGVHVHSNDNFSVTMNDNEFKDNTNYAAFVEFGSTLDHIEISGNKASNNMINGVGITGNVRYDLELLPAGDDFPYVVPDSLEISSQGSLNLYPKTVVKFATDSQLDVKGHLNIQGSKTNKVYFTSLLDDSKNQDTNNDGNLTEPYESIWKGIVYHSGSEGTFNNFECLYSTLNMDYSKIPYLKAVAKGDDSVVISGRYAAYIEEDEGISSIKVYDFYTKEVKTISSSSNKKINVMLDSITSGTKVAWIEDGIIKYSSVNEKGSKVAFSDIHNVTYAYLQDNKIVFIDNGNIYYGDLNGSKTLISDASTKFKPVINEKYVFYHHQANDMLYRRDIASNEDYYIMTTYNTFSDADLYGDDIALLASYDGNSRKEILIGDIPSWTAIQPSKGPIYYNHASLYKDKLTYTSKTKLNDKQSIYITESSTNNQLSGDEQYLATGYNVRQTDIGENSFVFTDNELVYLLHIKSPTINKTFVHEDSTQSTALDRNLVLGANFGISIGGSAELWGILEPGLEFSTSREGTLNYTLHKESLNQPYAISIGREIVDSVGASGSIDIGVGVIKDILDIKFLGASLSGERVKLRNDSYTFGNHETDTYKNLGLLTGAGLIRFLDTPSSLIIRPPFMNLVSKILVNKMEQGANIYESTLSYDKSFGLGFNLGLDGYLGITVENDKLGSIGGNIESGAETSSMAIVGEEKTENNEYLDYVKFSASNTLEYPKLFVAGNIGFIRNFPEIGWKYPKPLFYDNGSKNMVMETVVKSNGDVIINYTTGAQNKYGYNYTYTYTIENGVQLLAHKVGFEGLSSFDRNLNSITNDESLELDDFKIENEGIAMGFLVGLLNLISEDVKVDYEISLSKGNPLELDMEFSTSGEPMTRDGKVLDKLESYAVNVDEVSGAIGIGGMADDEVSIIVDSGTVRNGKIIKSNLIMASIPVEDDSMISVVYNIVNEFGKQLMPKTVKYKNNQATYDNLTVTLPKNHNLRSVTFLSTDVNIEEGSNGIYMIDDNQYLIGEYTYVESKDQNKKVISSYPSGATLTFDITSGGAVQQAAIYQYNEDNDEWIKLGGKIEDNGNGTGKISIELRENGQYALGFDKNQPQVIFKHQGIELSSGTQLFLNDYIDIEIIDDLPLKNVVLKLNGKEIQNYGSSSQFSYGVQGELGNTYILEVVYQDRFGNEFKDSITYVIKEKNTNTLIEDERIEIIDEIIHEVSDNISNEFINQEDEVTDEIIGSEDNIEGGLLQEQNSENVDNQG